MGIKSTRYGGGSDSDPNPYNRNSWLVGVDSSGEVYQNPGGGTFRKVRPTPKHMKTKGSYEENGYLKDKTRPTKLNKKHLDSAPIQGDKE